MKLSLFTAAAVFLIPVVALTAQSKLDTAVRSVEASLEESLGELSTLRQDISEKKAPLAKELNTLNAEVSELRNEFEKVSRASDATSLDLSSLELNVKQRQDEVDYVVSLMTEYISNIESRADASELEMYQPKIDATLLAVDNPELDRIEVITAQLEVIEMGVDRIESIIGGQVFPGSAVTDEGELEQGSFVLFGPSAYFASNSGASGLSLAGKSGAAAIIPVGGAGSSIVDIASSSSGELPLDPTLGKAIAIASTEESVAEHILKGGVWVFPILGFAFVSLIISIYKLFELTSVKGLPGGSMTSVIKLYRSGNKAKALHEARALPGPSGELVAVGVENADEPKELLEEILLERMIATQPKIERLLSVIAVTAATAPLLGLLGTVTGMINTFKLITIFGTGDAKSLSGGISEALITTEFGLVVAIPSLLFHAFLSRRAKSIMASMERSAMSFVNGVKATSK
ncbi:MotA/TolQ/ExbB proton channel family protein [Pelagicoccus sp. SDUM812002]|uniref:MotA/TolQ/ExbB proton channel family protein n=1 Tax=Pelagicoccus sp. SDUM812002 TaxID=3041266 RepID=UPI00280E2EDC|nr:MotA/TolQ/ExbB proton channel family protein [Pelagicoccus sp. SDUM812002]MDQ8187787.1 MotA/TolQ/ExbB proton channel family protein [Pelagicoccus sp. SDUM812002]